jgi:hypothetical protein
MTAAALAAEFDELSAPPRTHVRNGADLEIFIGAWIRKT